MCRCWSISGRRGVPPCRGRMPTLEDLAQDRGEEARVVKVNVEEEPGLRDRFAVSTLPTLLLFSGGEMRDRMIGVQSRTRLSTLLDGAA
ncbi:thioredoxin domain-containing protein [uncultured Sphingomonas sp.]|uniref:thioredoxin family protein n=1 Tax=uncultured Sphingomonas sp. TaxID=158754 RepID=UPI0025D3E77F|nr:thioredoxin domain-containing protein [uncultured Sphingomonas sp.]